MQREAIQTIDKQGVLLSAQALADQCEHAWQAAKDIVLPENYKHFDTVIFSGMGGSGLGARVIESIYAKETKAPILRVHDYELPAFANDNTLVFCSSYSGMTEETLSVFEKAIKRKCKVIVIASGGALAQRAREENIPAYIIEPIHNPSGQPRMAVGYSIFGQLALATKTGLISISEEEITHTIKTMRALAQEYLPGNNNVAEDFARHAKGKKILFFSAEHLVGAMHAFNNQVNENAKNISCDFEIPELNHHLMEGLTYPQDNASSLIVFLALSKRYSFENAKRFAITAEVLEKQGIAVFSHTIKGKGALVQAMSLIQLGAYASTYLAVAYEQDPAPIPWVDFFKKRLKA